jgi:hypothetical protein
MQLACPVLKLRTGWIAMQQGGEHVAQLLLASRRCTGSRLAPTGASQTRVDAAVRRGGGWFIL